METNGTAETFACLLWETLKAHLRDCIISYLGLRNELNKARLLELAGQIHLLDRENGHHPSTKTYKQILESRLLYNQIALAPNC